MTFSSDDGTIYILFAVLAIPILIVFPLVVRLLKLLRIRRALKSKTIIAMYDVPAGLSPAEIGYIYDMKLGTSEIVATLFDLEYRGYVGIDTDGRVTTLKQPEADMKQHEVFVMMAIAEEGIRNMKDMMLPGMVLTFTKLVRESLINLGLMNRNIIKGYIIRMLKITFLVAPLTTVLFTIWILVAANAGPDIVVLVVLLLGIVFMFFFFPFYALLGLILTLIYVKIDGVRWIGTKQLRDIWSDIEGYKMFIKQTDSEKLRFVNEKLKQQSKEKDLSYSIAMGINIAWQARFDA